MKDELGGKIMTEFFALRPKAKNNKQKEKEKRSELKLKFNDYKDCLLNNKISLKSQ